MRALHLALLAAGLCVLPTLGCSCPVHALPLSSARSEWRSFLTLYSHPLELRISRPGVPGPPVLVVYATGDGGWRGLDEQVYEWMSADGYSVVGFSSRDYLKNLGYVSETTTPGRLVQDFGLIIGSAEDQLGLPASTPVILAGLSRGAGLSTVAAGHGTLQPRLAGLLAIALTKEEEYVRHYGRWDRRGLQGAPRRELVEIRTYEYLSRISAVPVMVIQSTGDNYITADDARVLFGPDTPLRRLRAIQASNHRFSGGCDALYQETIAGLDWIRDLHSLRSADRTNTKTTNVSGASPGLR
jgi:hypothetical protein